MGLVAERLRATAASRLQLRLQHLHLALKQRAPSRRLIELEEERRGLPRGSLQPFLRQPYLSDLPITEYTTCRNAKVEALLFGSGEKLGEWEAFTLFYVKPDGAQQWRAILDSPEVRRAATTLSLALPAASGVAAGSVAAAAHAWRSTPRR